MIISSHFLGLQIRTQNNPVRRTGRSTPVAQFTTTMTSTEAQLKTENTKEAHPTIKHSHEVLFNMTRNI